MKKRLLSIVLTTALVLTTVFAGAQGVFANTNSSLSKSSLMNATEVSTTTIKAVDMNSGSTAEAYQVQYNNSEAQYVPIYIPKAGTFEINLQGLDYQYGSYVKVKSSPTAAAGTIGNSAYVSSSKPTQSLYVQVSKAGTYYLEFSTTYSGSYKTAFAVYYAPAGGTPTKGYTYYGSSPNGTVSYYKVTAPSTGYLTVTFAEGVDSYPSYSIKLANSKKKSLFKGFEYLSSSANYETKIGVSKGTYYIAVKSSDKAYGMDISFKSVKENSGSSKSSAKRIYKGGSKYGIITASQSSTSGDWYKFTVSRSQKVNFQLDAMVNGGGASGGVKVIIYQFGRYTTSSTNYLSSYTPSIDLNLYTVGKKTLSPGTYYIKVVKNNGGNGQYKIKWL